VIAPFVAAGLAAVASILAWMAVSVARQSDLLVRIGRPTSDVPRLRRSIPASVRVVATSILAGISGGLVAGVPGGVAGIGIVVAVPFLTRRRRAAQRAAAVQDQLAQAVSTIAACLRSGRSVSQAIELAADELDPPLGPCFRRMADRLELGDPFPETVEAWALDVGGPDVRLAAGVFQLHRRTGGALASTLEELGSTLRERRSAARELRSLTAQARLSATILGLLPIGFFLFLSAIARQDLQEAYRTRMGATAIALGLALQASAYLWIRRLLRVEP